jgi:glycosyltransferase involved in cell wall biosynthesis
MAWQKKMYPNLAILSSSQNAYSETFIQAHKQIPDVNVRYYYGDPYPIFLEDSGALERSLWISAFLHLSDRILGSKFVDRRESLLFRSLRREKIDCVLAEYGVTGANVLNVCKKRKLPLIVTFFGYEISAHQILQQYQQSYVEMFQYVSAIVIVSEHMRQRLENLGCPADKIYFSPSGPHEMFFDVRPDFSQKLFVSTGRFVDKKAHYYTILAFNHVLKKHPEARLIIAGDGVLMNACVNLVRYLRIEHAVSFPGVITLQEFAAHLAVARAYVQHSITALSGDMEGTPVAVMESSAAGVPVVSTRHAGIPDVVIDGETGLLVDEHDVDGMAQAMLKLLEDRQLAVEMGAKGRDFILKNFSRQKHLALLSRIVLDSIALNAGIGRN